MLYWLMRILFASSEVYPFSKTGGLADVIPALAEALVALGHEVLVVSPWYKQLKARPAPLWIGDISVPFDGGWTQVGVGELSQRGVRYAFVGHSFYQRDSFYGYADDTYRFALFNRAIPQVAARVHFMPDVFHLHDWQSAYVPAILQRGWDLPEGMPYRPSVFTVHNVQYQGSSALMETINWLRLPTDMASSYMNYFNTANAMQAAIGFANRVTTVSPSYAEEIKQAEYGYGLDGSFRHISHKLQGILNGIDTHVWDPATDSLLAHTYGLDEVDDLEKIRQAKALAKEALCQRFHITQDRPLMAIVSRLAEQKGIDIFLAAAPELLNQGWNLLVLGSGDRGMEGALEGLRYHHQDRVGVMIGYDESLAHLIYAGADSLAIPSRFEPCGLTQMLAMRYGTIPIARATGGLKDTITHGETGFLFEDAHANGLLWASWGAYQTYQNDHWGQMILKGMGQDFSWTVSAKRYEGLYRELVG
ncbi:MAG: glycogen synthase [Deinococcales bacterium]